MTKRDYSNLTSPQNMHPDSKIPCKKSTEGKNDSKKKRAQ